MVWVGGSGCGGWGVVCFRSAHAGKVGGIWKPGGVFREAASLGMG